MIKAADLPAVRARADDTPAPDNETIPAGAAVPVTCYPSKKLVLDNGRYVVAEPTK